MQHVSQNQRISIITIQNRYVRPEHISRAVDNDRTFNKSFPSTIQKMNENNSPTCTLIFTKKKPLEDGTIKVEKTAIFNFKINSHVTS